MFSFLEVCKPEIRRAGSGPLALRFAAVVACTEGIKTGNPPGRLRAFGPSLRGCRRIFGSLQNQMETSFHLVLKAPGCPARRGEYLYILCHYITGKGKGAMLYW